MPPARWPSGNLPIGTAHLTDAYARVHGIESHEAAEALAARTRLSIGKEWPLPAGTPSAHTGTAMALMPMLEKLTGEIATTGDYFEFQRLAGRARRTQAVAPGRANRRLCRLAVRHAAGRGHRCRAAADRTRRRALNLLEGMRTGLLKIGNQHYDFAGGRFVLAGANQSRRRATRAWPPSGSRLPPSR